MEGESYTEFKGFSCKTKIMSVYVEEDGEGGGGYSGSGGSYGGDSSEGNYYSGGGGGSSTSPASSPPPAPAPEEPIENIEEYLKCFDLKEPAKLGIYVDQPVGGSSISSGSIDGVGHTFIGLQQGKNISILGFYPKGESLRDKISGDGICGNNEKYHYDISIATSISASQ